jgi:hypothetical protein
MDSFYCSKCGTSYYSDDNFTGCPNCWGFGKVDRNCLCKKVGTLAGPLNVITSYSLLCPNTEHAKLAIEKVLRERGGDTNEKSPICTGEPL